eukprot:CAMPEP_0176421466 /NCGR_PEP_ID=MMETSP0127-20121128/9190_1 /TAXON_ID=938130 /ORGANISM="Platyophrya macrostoma, Strain WH" /LENGTH=90 /DNA_ID=CAMNT_0017802201 /DNA_START=69 /DNA_END=341 /DNA_ORIENTATION=+
MLSGNLGPEVQELYRAAPCLCAGSMTTYVRVFPIMKMLHIRDTLGAARPSFSWRRIDRIGINCDDHFAELLAPVMSGNADAMYPKTSEEV